MFTGIIEAVGKIKRIKKPDNLADNGLSLEIAAGNLDLSDVVMGDSIAVNGVCLTVTSMHADFFSVHVSRETLGCTYGLDLPGIQVNLEKAMRLSDRLGGHLVSGHVDGIGAVVNLQPTGESTTLTIQADEALFKYIAKKGSITVNGVSLTVNQLFDDKFSVNLIPHTLSATNLTESIPGAKVNLETDMLARYVARLITISK
ncbi:MAG: riboflavin synthase subunit alpha [Nitrosomonas sp.]|nr:MAG: riboflavin synthase subunit alpha [Nitrosomonas sp.]